MEGELYFHTPITCEIKYIKLLKKCVIKNVSVDLFVHLVQKYLLKDYNAIEFVCMDAHRLDAEREFAFFLLGENVGIGRVKPMYYSFQIKDLNIYKLFTKIGVVHKNLSRGKIYILKIADLASSFSPVRHENRTFLNHRFRGAREFVVRRFSQT